MAANHISTLPTKEERQIAKLELAQTKRQLVGTPGYRELRYYDVDLLPTKYSGNNVVNTPHPSGLVQGRPWKTTPNIISGLWRTTYDGYFNDNGSQGTRSEEAVAWFDTIGSGIIIQSTEVVDFSLPDANIYSLQYLGYFRALHTANYTFYLESDDEAYFWISDNAITGYTAANADLYSWADSGEKTTDPIALQAGEYYPIRLQYGNVGGPALLNFSWSDDFINIESTGLVILLNAANGWDGYSTWLNDPVLEQAVFNPTTLNYPGIDTTGGITSMSFDGASTYWDITNPTSGDFSIGVWFNTTSTAGTGTYFYDNPNIVGSDSAGVANDWGLCMRNGQIGFGAVSGNTAFTTPTFNDGVWHYVVATRVQTTGAMTIFVDGVQLAQLTEAPGAVLNATPYIRIAGDPTNTEFWQGLIAEVHFNQIALSPTQVASNFANERGVYGV